MGEAEMAGLWAIAAAMRLPAEDALERGEGVLQPPAGPTVLVSRADMQPVPPAGVEQWRALVSQYNWPVEQVLEVIRCESGGRNVASPDGQNIGPLQVNVIHSGKLREGESLWEPEVSIRIAYEIWADQGWGPWSCSPW